MRNDLENLGNRGDTGCPVLSPKTKEDLYIVRLNSRQDLNALLDICNSSYTEMAMLSLLLEKFLELPSQWVLAIAGIVAVNYARHLHIQTGRLIWEYHREYGLCIASSSTRCVDFPGRCWPR